MFQFKYILNEQDYFDFNRYHTFNSPVNKKYMLIYRFTVPAIFAVWGFLAGRMADEAYGMYYFYTAFGVAALLWMIFFKQIMLRMLKRNINRIKKKGKLPYQSDVTISFEDDFYIEKTENGESKVKYSVIERVVIAESAIYIYTNAVQAILLPFTAFPDEQKRGEFIAFIEGKRAAR